MDWVFYIIKELLLILLGANSSMDTKEMVIICSRMLSI